MTSTRTETKQHNLEQKFKTALGYVRQICVFGATNKIEDLEKTGGWSLFHTERYLMNGEYKQLAKNKKIPKDQEQHHTYLDKGSLKVRQSKWYFHADISPNLNIMDHSRLAPLFDSRFNLSDKHLTILANAMLTIEKRQGNCEEQSALVAKYLWEHPQGIDRIECFSTNTFEHRLIVVNRKGNSNDPDTWGDTWIIDAWYGDKGLIFPAKDFKKNIKKIKEFFNMQMDHYKKLGKSLGNYNGETDEDLDKVEWEIRPAVHKYPTYESNYTIEDYHFLANCYPAGNKQKEYYFEIKTHYEKLHKIYFKDCLVQIKELGNKASVSKQSLVSLFRKRKELKDQEQDSRPAKKRRI